MGNSRLCWVRGRMNSSEEEFDKAIGVGDVLYNKGHDEIVEVIDIVYNRPQDHHIKVVVSRGRDIYSTIGQIICEYYEKIGSL